MNNKKLCLDRQSYKIVHNCNCPRVCNIGTVEQAHRSRQAEGGVQPRLPNIALLGLLGLLGLFWRKEPRPQSRHAP
jgi:hypothetical protein